VRSWGTPEEKGEKENEMKDQPQSPEKAGQPKGTFYLKGSICLRKQGGGEGVRTPKETKDREEKSGKRGSPPRPACRKSLSDQGGKLLLANGTGTRGEGGGKRPSNRQEWSIARVLNRRGLASQERGFKGKRKVKRKEECARKIHRDKPFL